MRPGSDEQWEDLLRQLRTRPPVRPRPFFYARVHVRLAGTRPAETVLPGWLRRPAYAVLLGALVLTLSGDGIVLRPAPHATSGSASHGGQPR